MTFLSIKDLKVLSVRLQIYDKNDSFKNHNSLPNITPTSPPFPLHTDRITHQTCVKNDATT